MTNKDINWYSVSEYHYRNDYVHYRNKIHKSKAFIKSITNIHTRIFTVKVALDSRARVIPECQLCSLNFAGEYFSKPEDFVSLIIADGFLNTVCCKYCAKTIIVNSGIVPINYKNLHENYVEFINIIRKKKNEETNF